MVAFAHRVRKPDDAFFIDIADEAAAFTAVGTTDLAPVTVFLEMGICTHSWPRGFSSFAHCTFAL